MVFFYLSVDCWFPGGFVVPEPAGMYIWSIHLHPYAGESTHLVRLHVAFSHQPYQNLILQVPFLAAQTIGKSQT